MPKETGIGAKPEQQVRELRSTDMLGHRFALTRRGYDPDEVQGFLRLIAEQLSRLEAEIEWQRARSDQLEHRGSAAQEATYKRLSRAFMDAVARADQAATRVKIAAEEEAKVRVDAAREEAARTVIAGQEEADRILSAAQDEAAWLTEQAKETVARTRRMVAGVHPSMPRIEVMSAGPSELDLEEFDLQFDASLFDLP
jgi:DivIVA domain-containing protein